MPGKKIFGAAKAPGKESPQSPPADFGAFTGKAFDRPFRMFASRFGYGRFDLQPVTHGIDLAKRHAGLRHAERAGIHAEEDDTFALVAESSQIIFVRRPGVLERVVNVRNGRLEF